MKKRNPYNQNGFSLIEIVLLIVLLGIAIPPLASLMNTNLKATGRMSQISNATFCARQRMEQIIADYTAQGYAVITASGRYSSETNATTGITTTVDIASATWNGQTYARVTVTATVPTMNGSISLVANLPRDPFP